MSLFIRMTKKIDQPSSWITSHDFEKNLSQLVRARNIEPWVPILWLTRGTSLARMHSNLSRQPSLWRLQKFMISQGIYQSMNQNESLWINFYESFYEFLSLEQNRWFVIFVNKKNSKNIDYKWTKWQWVILM